MFVFGGPYGNLRALRAVRSIADALSPAPDRVVCTGDTVAYCAEPNETVDALREWGAAVVAGNVERQLAADRDDCGCNFREGSACDALSVRWYGFLRETVAPGHVRWMDSLPDHARFEIGGLRAIVVHGAPSEIARFVFASTPWKEKRAEIARAEADLVVAGHSGLPFADVRGGLGWWNPGVVGMPAHDGTPRGWYGILDAVAGGGVRGSIRPFEYDAGSAARAMLAHRLPEEYARALTSGLWPSDEVLPARERAAAGVPLEVTEIRLEHG